MTDFDHLLRSDISLAAAQTAEPPEFTTIERRGTRRRRTRTVLMAAATAAAVMLTVGVVAASQTGDQDPQRPLGDPTPSPSETTDPATARLGWSAQHRPDSSAQTVTMKQDRDGADAAIGAIDILDVTATRRPGWSIKLRAEPPLASTLDPARRIIQHGVVVDADGDAVADCHLGINTDTPEPGELRVWVKNLTTGLIDEQVGPPYGVPFDFAHPSEGEEDVTGAGLSLFFLSNIPQPCEGFGPEATFYTYAQVIEQGRVTALDYAPDTAWLRFS